MIFTLTCKCEMKSINEIWDHSTLTLVKDASTLTSDKNECCVLIEGREKPRWLGPVCLGFFQLLTTKSCCELPNVQFLARFYKNCFGKNRPKSTWTQNRSSHHDSRNTSFSRFWTLWATSSSSVWNPHDTQILSAARFSEKLVRKKVEPNRARVVDGIWGRRQAHEHVKRILSRCGCRLVGHVSRMWETCIWYTTCEDFDGWASRLSITIIRRFRWVRTSKLGSKVQRESEVTHDVIMKGMSRQINLVKTVWQSD
jgi:hypothetical protein